MESGDSHKKLFAPFLPGGPELLPLGNGPRLGALGNGFQNPSLRYLHELGADCKTLDNLAINFPGIPLKHALPLLHKEMKTVMDCLAEVQSREVVASSSVSSVASDYLLHNLRSGSVGDENLIRAERKVFVPTDKFPKFNFIGRILGPRGMSVKQLEFETDCKILIRGVGSVRDSKKEERLSGRKGWEHLREPLHILVTAEGWVKNEVETKVEGAAAKIRQLLVPCDTDEYKRKQLVELAVINGTYRASDVQCGGRNGNYGIQDPLASL